MELDLLDVPGIIAKNFEQCNIAEKLSFLAVTREILSLFG